MPASNAFLKKMGFSATDRVVVLHADDIGMCQSTVSAYADMLAFGLISSAAVMVPCPWFPAAAERIRELASSKPDVGVHMTLTAEWDTYRWAALSTADPATGLFDPTGYFPHRTDPIRVHASPDAVALELRAQFEKALAFGIDVTHIDSHMLSVFTPAYLPLYLGLAFEHRVPAFALRQDLDALRARGFDEAGAADLVRVTNEFEEQGLPIFDHVYCMSLNTAKGRVAEAAQALAECPSGLTHFIVHPASDTPELQAIAPDWRSRVADRALFLDEAWKSAIAASGVHVIGYRALRDAIRAD